LNRRTNTVGSGYTVTYASDAGHRLTQVVHSVGGTINQVSDLLDRLTTQTTGLGTIRYDNPSNPSDRGYDTLDRRRWMEVPGQPRITYTLDAVNRLTQMQQGSQTVSFSYDNADRRTVLTLQNG